MRSQLSGNFQHYAGVNINPPPHPGTRWGLEGIWDLHHAQGGGALELFRSVSDLGGGGSGALVGICHFQDGCRSDC